MMKLHSIATPIGAALLVEITEPAHGIEAPEGFGLVFWGRCARATFGHLILSSKAKWIADYDIKSKSAIVMWPPEIAGKTMDISTSAVDAVCPSCGSTEYWASGINWRCKVCDRQWRQQSGGKRGRPPKNHHGGYHGRAPHQSRHHARTAPSIAQ